MERDFCRGGWQLALCEPVQNLAGSRTANILPLNFDNGATRADNFFTAGFNRHFSY
jgi:hypothetical protein